MHAPTPPGNRYCARLGLDPVPRVEDALGRPGVKLFHLVVVALLERGGPMPLEAVVERLAAAGAVVRSGDLRLSVVKAWHGRQPVVREPDSRLALDLSSSELEWVLLATGLARPRPVAAPPPEPPPDPVLPGEEVPLTAEELDAAFRDRGVSNLSSLRQAAAVLDVHGRPMGVEEVEAVLASLTRYRRRLDLPCVGGWRSSLVTLGPDGRLVLDRGAPEMPAVRRVVRGLAREGLGRQAREAHSARLAAEWEAAREAERRQQAAEAARLRHAILRVVSDAGPVGAAALLDVGARTIRTRVGPEVASIGDELEAFDVLAGLTIRDTLHRLGADPDRWRLADLGPPQKTLRLNRAGRTLRITPELLIRSTTGVSHPLADPSNVARYLTEGDTRRLVRRIESDLKALHAFYQYGRLHGAVRLRWGFLDEQFPVGWSLPGEPPLWSLLRRAGESRAPVEVVVGCAPGWSEPWSRARSGLVASIVPPYVTFLGKEGPWTVLAPEIQALRLAPGAATDAP